MPKKTSPLFVAFVSETLNLDPKTYHGPACVFRASLTPLSPQLEGALAAAAGGGSLEAKQVAPSGAHRTNTHIFSASRF